MTTLNEQQLRELNCWVAENVMGETVLDFGGKPHIKIGQSRFNPEDDLVGNMPKYHSDPEAAMLVLEKCAQLDFPTVYRSRADEETWCVDNLRMGNDSTICVTAETLPLAICLFAQQLFSK